MEKPEKEKRELLSFPVLIGIFVYFSAIIVVMAIYWQTGTWYQNSGLTSIGTAFSVVLVVSVVVFLGLLFAKRR